MMLLLFKHAVDCIQTTIQAIATSVIATNMRSTTSSAVTTAPTSITIANCCAATIVFVIAGLAIIVETAVTTAVVAVAVSISIVIINLTSPPKNTLIYVRCFDISCCRQEQKFICLRETLLGMRPPRHRVKIVHLFLKSIVNEDMNNIVFCIIIILTMCIE